MSDERIDDMIDYFPDDVAVEQRLTVARGQCIVTADATTSIETKSLGAGVAVGVYDPMTGAVALAHLCYPNSDVNKRKAGQMKGHFADTGITHLIEELKQKGSDLVSHSCIVTVVGGAHALGPKDSFAFGADLVAAVRGALAQHGIEVAAEDVEGHINRRLSIYAETGDMCVSALGKHYKLL